MKSTILLLMVAMATACGKGDKAPGGGSGDGGDQVVLPGEPDDSWVDTLPQAMREPPGNAHGGLDLEFDPTLKDAVTAYADCGAWLGGCLQDTQGDFDACVAKVPICQTEEPWNEGDCCPQACQDQYQGEVAGGRGSFEAYAETFATDRTCFAGLQGGAR